VIQAITRERWERAQIAEAALLAGSPDADHFKRSYECYFAYLGMSFDQQGKVIVEIGCADFPAVSYCQNVKGIIVEPLVTPQLKRVVDEHSLYWIRWAVEEMTQFPEADEVWLLNVMQHVIDPELFVSRCKQMALVIRFFEPIDYETSEYHPHTFTIDDFSRWFGRVSRYLGGSREGFHQADCAYGTWRR